MSASAELTYYLRDATPLFASRSDPRLSFCLYVPRGYDESRAYPLAVLIHGTERRAEGYRDRFAGWAEQHDAIVLAPLFPAGIPQPWDLNGYKWLTDGETRYDLALIDMVDQVADVLHVDTSRFLMHGFSGGGHFTHRFLYLHPERLRGASIGAPGIVTLLDQDRDWWVGVRGIERMFGRGVDLDAVRAVPVQTVIGGDDTETWEITLQPGDGQWMEGADLAGPTRLDRIAALADTLEAVGVSVRRDIVPGVGHDGFAVLEPVRAFFAEHVR